MLDAWVLLPVLYRPENLRCALQSLKETAPDVGVVVAIEADDDKSKWVGRSYNATVAICSEYRAGCARAWNTALAATPGNAWVYVLGADDVIFLPGWIEAAEKALQRLGGSGLIGLRDNRKNEKYPATHYAMTKDYLIQHNGGVMACPHYVLEGVDVEAIERAKCASKYALTDEVCIEHNWNGHKPDWWFLERQQKGNRMRRLLEERRKAQWPDDFQAVLR